MGTPMAGRLLAAGPTLVVHDARRAAAAPLLDRGAQWADSPADVARRAKTVNLRLQHHLGLYRHRQQPARFVRQPRCSGVDSARTTPSRPASKKFVFDSTVVVVVPGGRLRNVAVAPTMSASAISVPPWSGPPTVRSWSRMSTSATTRSRLASTKRTPRSSVSVPR